MLLGTLRKEKNASFRGRDFLMASAYEFQHFQIYLKPKIIQNGIIIMEPNTIFRCAKVFENNLYHGNWLCRQESKPTHKNSMQPLNSQNYFHHIGDCIRESSILFTLSHNCAFWGITGEVFDFIQSMMKSNH